MKKNKLLTITMLVSNREDTIEKCMESLVPLREAVSSELIIVDTAGDRACMDIVERYADQIIPFTWCDDFAAARNAGLRQASGEWVLFLDDDEWFQSTEEIQKFFLSGNYKKYCSAAYMTRNYMNRQGTTWSDRIATRMTRLDKETKFRGKIHESLFPVKRPTFYMKDYVHHYGYVFDTKQESIAHSWRNIRPLLERRREEPQDFQAAAQLIQEYRGVQEYFSAIEVAKELRQDPGWKEPQKLGFTSYAMVSEVELYRDQQRYRDAYDVGRELLSNKRILLFARGCITNIMIGICNQLERYMEALTYIHDFTQLLKQWEKQPENHYTDFFSVSGRYLNQDERKRFRLVKLHIYVQQQKWEDAGKCLEEIPWGEEQQSFQVETPEDVVQTAVHSSIQATAFQEAFYAMQRNDLLLSKLYETIDALEEKDRRPVLSLLAQMEPEQLKLVQYHLDYYLLQRDEDKIMRLLSLMQEKNFSLFIPMEGYWTGLDNMQICLESYLTGERIDNYLHMVETLTERLSMGDCQAMSHVLMGGMPQSDIRYRYIQGLMLEKELSERRTQRKTSCGDGEEPEDGIHEDWNDVVKIAKLWLGCAEELYREEIFSGERQSALPAKYQFSWLICQGQITEQDKSQQMRYIAEAAKAYLPMGELCKEYLKALGQEKKDSEFGSLFSAVKQQIPQLVQQERYTDALQIMDQLLTYQPGEREVLAMKAELLDYLSGEEIPVETALTETDWELIREELSQHPCDFASYVKLARCYGGNAAQAQLCYAQALFYMERTGKNTPETAAERARIEKSIQHLREKSGVTVPKVAIVILSYNLLDYTRKCIDSIRRTVPQDRCQIIVVDNASTDGSVEWLRRQGDIILLENAENVGFPKGCNQGIALAEGDADIYLLNNDTILPENALFWLQMGLYEEDHIGTVGSVSNCVYNHQQVSEKFANTDDILTFARKNNIPMAYPYEPKLFLIGFSMLIRRSAMDQVGLLDEIFTPGNSEDVDYGLRMRKAGYRNVLCRNSFVLHFGSQSFRKKGAEYGDLLSRNQEKLNRKWEMDLQYYMFPRPELVQMIQRKTDDKMKVLDIGCGCGAIMARIKGDYPEASVYGIELSEKAAALAQTIGEVICGDVENMEFSYEKGSFDYCIMGNLLEHLRDPEKVLRRLRSYMKPNGHIIVSMPNMKHYSVMLPLLKRDQFSYGNSGILDRTHLKMYTNHEIQNLLMDSGYHIEEIRYTTAGEPTPEEDQLIQQLTSYMEEPDRISYLAYQYIVDATL
ncbi:MAG: glycosyltransferase [Lachnospiraceae bacterium]|nr:glycosyltransferase [Lachnospiraceae bacterium]